MRTISGWLRGRKTYLLAGGLLTVTLGLVFTGRLTVSSAMSLGLIAAAGFPATFRAALAQHHDDELALIEAVAATGVGVAAHNLVAAESSGAEALRAGIKLVGECKADAQSGESSQA